MVGYSRQVESLAIFILKSLTHLHVEESLSFLFCFQDVRVARGESASVRHAAAAPSFCGWVMRENGCNWGGSLSLVWLCAIVGIDNTWSIREYLNDLPSNADQWLSYKFTAEHHHA